MKKLLGILVVAAMVMGIVSCSSNATNTTVPSGPIYGQQTVAPTMAPVNTVTPAPSDTSGAAATDNSAASTPAATDTPAAAAQAAFPTDAGVTAGMNVTSNGDGTYSYAYPLVPQTMNLNVFASPEDFITDLNTNKFTTYYEQQTNVHVVWDVAQGSDAGQKLTLAMSSGSMPEVILDSMDQNFLSNYGGQGLVLPMNNLIATYGTWTRALFQQFPGAEQLNIAPDGNIYGLPQINQCLHCTYPEKCWVNTDFMTKLGLQLPTTTDQFEQMLLAFKNDDPNGNGKADEVPMSGTYQSWHADIDNFLISPFEYYDDINGDCFSMTNDTITCEYDTPQWQEAVTWIHKLYTEGLIDPQALTQDNSALSALADADPEVLGCYTSGGFNMQNNQTGAHAQTFAQWIPPLTGPEGQINTFYNKYQDYQAGASGVITSACKNVDVAFMWLDGLYQPDINIMHSNGFEGTDWVNASPGQVGLDGSPALTVGIGPAYGDQENDDWASMGPSYGTNVQRNGLAVDPTVFNNQAVLLWATTGHNGIPGMMGHEPAQVVPPLYLTSDEVNSISEAKAALISYRQQAFAQFVTGQMDISKDWDSYVANVKALGLDNVISVEQNAYNRQYLGQSTTSN